MSPQIGKGATPAYLDRALLTILGYGQVPKHIALIMDGNRRYARLNKMAIAEGHTEGFANAANVIYALRDVGVTCISFFMFGVDNFKRDPKEIEDIMEIIKHEVSGWVAPGGLAHQLKVRLKLCGERNMLDADLMEVLDRAMDVTKHYTSGKVNLCIAYSGRREIAQGIRSIASGQPGPIPYSITATEHDVDISGKWSHEPSLSQTDSKGPVVNRHDLGPPPPTMPTDNKPALTPYPFTDRLWTRDDPPLDILIRTSGETRLSDYMLWQCCENTQLNFLRCYWPEIRVKHLAFAILNWRAMMMTGPKYLG